MLNADELVEFGDACAFYHACLYDWTLVGYRQMSDVPIAGVS
jgi:hypothetical protein